jgi:hypothetical protein
MTQAKGLRMGNEEAQHSPSGRTCPNQLLLVRVESYGDELGQCGTLLVEDPERPVASPGHGAGFLYDMAQERRKFEVPLNEQRCIEYPPQRRGVFD